MMQSGGSAGDNSRIVDPSPPADLRQDVSASGHAQQAALGSGVQNVFFGDRHQLVEPAVSLAPPFGQRAGHLPVRGREGLLSELLSPADDSRVWVIHGLGGCGKTRLAIEVAYQAQRQGTEVWWVSASEPSALIAAMRALGRRLGVRDTDLDHGDAADVIWQRLIERVDPWLLVIDNADDPQVLAGAGSAVGDGRGWLRPVSATIGMVLVTSRDGSEASWGPWCRRRRLAILPAEEATLMLADHARHHQELGTPADARRLAERLGGLPLALKIAGSYLAEAAVVPAPFADTSLIRTYGQYYEALERGQLDAFPAPGGELTQDQAPQLIGSTWDITLDLLDTRGLPEARLLLRLLATFASAPVPYQLLLDPATMAASHLFPAISGSRLWQALRALDGFGLIDLDAQTDSAIAAVRLHPLVRDASFQLPGIPGGERAAYFDLAARLLQRAALKIGVPEDPPTWPAWQLLAPHALEVFNLLESEPGCPDTTAIAATDAAELAARYRAEQRLHATAEGVLREVAAVRRRTLGPDHPRTLDTRHSIARRLLQQRNYADALREFRDVLEARLRLLGPEDPETLGVRHSIARTLAAQGDHDSAEAEFRDILTIRLRVLGPDHPRTLSTRHELGRTMAALGDYAGARDEFRDILPVQLERLGPDHPHTLSTRHHLAHATAALGDYANAEAEFRDILAARLKVLGPDHPHTLSTRYQLAKTRAALGDHAGAEAECRDVLAARQRVLGPDHPDTLATATFIELLTSG